MTTRNEARRLALGITLLVTASVAVAAPPDRSPLLRIHRTETYSELSSLPFGPLTRIDVHQDLVITNGGALRSTSYRSTNGGPWVPTWVNGQATEATLRALKASLIEGQVGQRTDCWGGGVFPGVMEFTWYGRNRRVHTFGIAWGETAPGGLAPCSSEVLTLLLGLGRFELEVQRDPGTEVLH